MKALKIIQEMIEKYEKDLELYERIGSEYLTDTTRAQCVAMYQLERKLKENNEQTI